MKKFLSLVLSLAMTLSLVTIGAGATDYKDLTDKSEIQYEEAVAVLNKIGIITGYEDGSFKPTGALTRGAAAKIIVSLMIGSDAASALTVTAAPYKDVPVTNTFAAVISYCKTAGYINGYTDGTFRPTAALTGYAFTKMLLGALGYDGTQEGFTGSGWTMNVAKLGNTAGLFNDFATAFSGNAGVDRESACLLALNTLKATEVQYSGGTSITTTTGNATTNVVTKQERSYKTSNNSKINQNIGKNKDNLSAEYTLEFGEEHFTDLKLTAEGSAEDDFGRPSNEWSYKNSKIGTYAKTADFTYTTGADGDTDADMVKDMGLKDYKVPETTYTVNGKSVAFKATTNAGKLAEIANLTDNGVLVEAYLDDDDADTVDAFVVVYSQIMQVNAVRSTEVTLKSVEDTYLSSSTYDSDSPNVDFPSVSTVTSIKDDDDAWANVKDLKADDFVVVVPVKDGSSYRVYSAVAPQTVTGSMTNIKVNSSNSSVKAVTVAGTAYNMSKLWTSKDKELKSTTKLNSKVDTTILLDTYGYAIYAKDVTASNSAIIIDEIYSSLVDGKIVKYAKGWDSTGNDLELNLGTSPSYPGGGDDADQQGKVCEYASYTSNNAEYQLVAAQPTWSDSDKNLVYTYGDTQVIANGQYQATITNSGKTLPFDSAVKFIYVSTDVDADTGAITDVTGITVKSGVSEVSDASDSTVTYVLNKDRKKVVAVVIPNDYDAGNTANLLFFQKVTNHINNADGKRVAIFTAYVNGEKLTDLQLNKDIDNAVDEYNNQFFTYSKNESTGVYSLTPYNRTDSKITSVQEKVDTDDADFAGVQNYYYKAAELSNRVLNAKNATVVDLYADDGITFSTVKEMKDAINEGRASNFQISYVFNGDSGNSAYNTISYLFIYKNNFSTVGNVFYNVAASAGLEFSKDGGSTYQSTLTSVAANTPIKVRADNDRTALTILKNGTPLALTAGVGTFTLTGDVAANTFTYTVAASLPAWMGITSDATNHLTLTVGAAATSLPSTAQAAAYAKTWVENQTTNAATVTMTDGTYTITSNDANGIPTVYTFTPATNYKMTISVDSTPTVVVVGTKVSAVVTDVTDSSNDYAKLVDGSYEAGSAAVILGHNYASASARYVAFTAGAIDLAGVDATVTYSIDGGASAAAPTYVQSGVSVDTIVTFNAAQTNGATVNQALVVASGNDTDTLAFSGNAANVATNTSGVMTFVNTANATVVAANDTVTITGAITVAATPYTSSTVTLTAIA